MVSSSRFMARPSVPSSNSSSSFTVAAGQSRDAGDAVADLDDAPDLLGAHRGVVVRDVLAQRLGDLAGTNRELCHHSFLFLVVSIHVADSYSWPDATALAQRAEAPARGGVQAQVADLDQHAAEEGRVDGDLELDRSCPSAAPSEPHELGLLVSSSGARRAHARHAPATGLGDVARPGSRGCRRCRGAGRRSTT